MKKKKKKRANTSPPPLRTTASKRLIDERKLALGLLGTQHGHFCLADAAARLEPKGDGAFPLGYRYKGAEGRVGE